MMSGAIGGDAVDNSIGQLRMMALSALMAALTAVGAFIAIPMGPVPIVLQNFFAMLAALLLGSRWGVASMAIYLFAGALGLPVFAGGTGGLARFAGPTGGYLISYLPMVFLIGYLSEKGGGRTTVDVLAMCLGALVLYAGGVTWLKLATGMSVGKAVTVGMLPFLPGDGVKIAGAAAVARAIRPILPQSAVSPLNPPE